MQFYFPKFSMSILFGYLQMLASLFILIIVGVAVYVLLRVCCQISDPDTSVGLHEVEFARSKQRRTSISIHGNRLPYKRRQSFGAFNLPQTFSQRRLFGRPEVTRYLGIRRQSKCHHVQPQQNLAQTTRRDSAIVANVSLQTATSRRFSVACGRQRHPSVVGNVNKTKFSVTQTTQYEHNTNGNDVVISNKSQIYKELSVDRRLSTIEEAKEPNESTRSDDVIMPSGRYSRKPSVRPIQRRASRRISILNNSLYDIPGIPTIENGPVHKSRRKSKSYGNGNAAIPKRIERGIRGDLSEFKSVFSPMSHNVLMKRYQDFGPIYQFSALGQNMVFLFDYKDLEFMKRAEGRCPRHIDFKHLRVYRERNGYPLGVLVSNGEEWRRQRKILSKCLLGSTNITNYIPAIDEVAKDATNAITTSQYSSFKPESFTGNYAIEAFGRVLYGQNMGCLNFNVINNMHRFVDISRSNFEDAKKLLIIPAWLMPLHPAWKRHNERWNFLLDVTMANIEMYGHRGLTYKNVCLLSQLLDNTGLDKGHMFINFTDLLVASIDTTSNVLQWCLYELGTHPDIQEKLYNEAQEVLGDNGHVTPEVLQRVVFTKAVVKETLRLHPVGFFTSRITEKDMYVRNYQVPSKAHVAMSMYVMGRNSELFPNPNDFRPERWLVNRPEIDRFYNDVPFGFGPRMCIGRRIAEIEVVAYILQFCLRFEFKSTCHDIEPIVRMLMVPNKPVTLNLTPRREMT